MDGLTVRVAQSSRLHVNSHNTNDIDNTPAARSSRDARRPALTVLALATAGVGALALLAGAHAMTSSDSIERADLGTAEPRAELIADQADTEHAEALYPSKRHTQAAQVVTSLIERSHYRRTRVDDVLSSQILDQYLKALDRNKLYFLAADIARFDRYRTRLDDAVRSGRVDPAFDIFNVYRTRVEERISYAKSALAKAPDFDVDESYVFDRTDTLWAANQQELDDVWRRRVKNDVLSLNLTGKEHEEITELLGKRYERVLKRTHQLNSDEVFESFMNAYADTLDPHSNYFSPRNSEEYRIQMSLSYDGIGASLNFVDDYVTVLDVIAGGPAAIDGTLAPKDRITGVAQGDDEMVDVIGWRLDDVVQLIRGPGGTEVRLQILPANAPPGSPEEILALQRDKVRLEAQAAQKEVLEVERGGKVAKIGVISVPSFYQDFAAKQAGKKDYTSTTADVRRLILDLQKEGVEGLIVDLRGNGGGHLWEARAMTGLFLEGPVVQFKEWSGRVRELDDIHRGSVYDGPLAVLVDRFSASASEIFAAAIQDYERGVVIGQNTFGKGSVQNLYDLDQVTRSDGMGQLTLTIGKYYRVTGESTQLRGVAPDISMPSLIAADQVGESTRDTAMPWDVIRATRFRMGDPLDDEINSLLTSHAQRAKTDPDLMYWRGQIDRVDELNSRKSVSLNLETRKEEQEAARQKRLSLENERRVAHNLEPITLDELDETEPVDVVLHEAGQIVGDLVEIAASPAPERATAAVNRSKR